MLHAEHSRAQSAAERTDRKPAAAAVVKQSGNERTQTVAAGEQGSVADVEIHCRAERDTGCRAAAGPPRYAAASTSSSAPALAGANTPNRLIPESDKSTVAVSTKSVTGLRQSVFVARRCEGRAVHPAHAERDAPARAGMSAPPVRSALHRAAGTRMYTPRLQTLLHRVQTTARTSRADRRTRSSRTVPAALPRRKCRRGIRRRAA